MKHTMTNPTSATLLATAIILAAQAPAHAQDAAAVATTSFVKPPPGWRSYPEQASGLAAKANEVSHFGGAPSLATAEVFVAGDAPAVLYVTAIAGKLVEGRDVAARVEVDSLRDGPRRVQLVSPQVFVDQWSARVDDAAKLVVVELVWRDSSPDTATVTHARMLIGGDSESLVAVTAECTMGQQVDAAVKAACLTALGSVDVGIPADRRVPITLAAEGVEAPPRPNLPVAGTHRLPATMDDGSRTPLPPMTISQPQRTTDRRPVYVGLGIVLLAALFWWNHRRRDRFDAKETDER